MGVVKRTVIFAFDSFRSASSSGDNTLVTAVSGKRIRPLRANCSTWNCPARSLSMACWSMKRLPNGLSVHVQQRPGER